MRSLGWLGTIMLTAAACGDDPAAIDAGADALPDAPPLDANVAPDASATAVTVTTYNRCCVDLDERLAGVPVFVRGPDGTLIDEGVTDASGEATLEAVANASVTAIFGVDDEDDLPIVTYLGVQPGDALVFGAVDASVPSPGTAVETMDVTWTAPGGVDDYTLVTSCELQVVTAPATSASIGVYDGCLVSTMDVMVVARSGGQNVSSSVLDDATFTADGTLVMPAFTALVPFDASATALPLSITAAQFSVSPVVGTRRGGGAFGGADNTTGAVTANLSIPDGADGTRVETILFQGNNAEQHLLRVVADGVAQSTSTGADVLPWVGGVAGDRDTRTLTWTVDGTAAYDGVVGTLEWTVSGGLFGGQERVWTVIAPPGTSLRWPELPAAHAADDVPTDTIVRLKVELLETAAVSDYGGLRDLGEPSIVCPECAPLDPATFPAVKRSSAAGTIAAE